jgi:mono/diheme cytochrome c family protein
VQDLVATKCQTCHVADPPGELLALADFQAPSDTPGKTVAEDALARLQSTGPDHMPPAPFPDATAAEIAAFQAWVDAGTTGTGCETTVPPGSDPYDTPVVCTSMEYWTNGDQESPLMHPGGACITCHTEEHEGPNLWIGGTVFPTPHEPTDCNGVDASSGAVVVVTDANGATHMLPVNAAGNFLLEGGSFAFPYRAKVVYQGRERAMVESQTTGDCNSCHTEAGSEDAPGRVFLP